LVRREEAFDLGAKVGVFSAGLDHVRGSCVRRALERALKQLLDLRPLCRRHGRVPASCAYSQALARAHSRPTVAGETCSSSAASSIVRPPKNLASTSLPCSGSKTASRVSASSSAIRSTFGATPG